MNFDVLDFAISFSATANMDADDIVHAFGFRYRIYDYRQFLVDQLGMQVDDVAVSVYGKIPVIILMTADWWERPATQLECKYIRDNKLRKLIFDYSGLNRNRIVQAGIGNFAHGKFERGGRLDMGSIREFLRDAFSGSDVF